MSRLYVDKNLMVKEFKTKLLSQIKLISKQIESDMQSNTTFDKALVKTVVKEIEDKIVLYIDGNDEFLLDNYGSGSLMDTKNNALIDEYIGNDNWNPHRSKSDTTIRGRDAGEYTDIFGNKKTSSGSMAGDDIEGLKIIDETTGGWIAIQPRYPSHLVEAAIEEFKVRCKSILNKAYDNMDFSKCLIYK